MDMTGKELVKFAWNSPRQEDRANIMARFIVRNQEEIVCKLEKAGYSQVSIDRLRQCVDYPTDPVNLKHMRSMLRHI